MDRFTEMMRSPEMKYRPRNYWGWLENITPDETQWQIEKMHEVGLGGYVMHARGGLTMPYMGDQWIASVKRMIETGKKYGMISIADDEHGWPSGFGAGKVNGLGEDYQLKYLLCEELKAADMPDDKGTLGIWKKADFAPVDDMGVISPEETLIRVYYKIDPFYVDNMDAKVVRAFIDASYEDYKKHVGESFGDGLYGIFSDEPQVARYSTPWSFIIPDLFRETYGYDLLSVIYKIFYDVDGASKVRYDMFCLMQKCFVENYAKQIYEWCDENRLNFVGHTCLEDEFYGQIRNSVGTMPFYEYMHVPGIDWLCRVALNNMTILQLTSAAAQTGKKRVLSEMYGCAGWNVSMEELKWIAQWQAVLGVNDQLQHLGLYSLRGSRKREYPASLFYQQPWFEKYGPYNEYFARISKLLCMTEAETDVLLIHPMKSAYVDYNGYDEKSTRKLQDEFIALTDLLLGMNIAVHYGDEVLMKKHGRVENGKLVVGCISYSAVMLPSLRTLDRSTIALLEKFMAQGGKVMLAGDAPTMIEGEENPEINDFCAKLIRITPDRDGIASAIERPVYVDCEGQESRLIYISRRNYLGKKIYYIVNNDLEHGYDFALVHPGKVLRAYDCMTGELSEAPVDTRKLHLDAVESIVLVEDCECSASPAADVKYANSILLDGDYRLVSAADNTLTLDRCALSLDSENYEAEANHLDIQRRLITDGVNRDIWLKFSFVVDEVPEGQIYLVMENPELHEIMLNGEKVDAAPVGWVVDKSFEQIPVSVKKGENTVILRRKFTNSANVYRVKNDPTIHEAEANRVTVETEIESIYIRGQFAVINRADEMDTPRRTICTAGDFAITKMPEYVNAERLEKQGFPFFAGSITLEKEFTLDSMPENARLSITRPDSIVTEFVINGTDAGMLIWAPYELDISGMLKEGANTLRMTLTNSCRNMLGPHHNLECEPYGVGPHSYPPQTTDIYLVRYGLGGGVNIKYNT